MGGLSRATRPAPKDGHRDGPLVIDGRFATLGPEPGFSHGGYAAGLVAELAGGVVEVTLPRPVPVDTPLAVERLPDGRVVARHGRRIVANAAPGDLDPGSLEVEALEPVPFDEAWAASRAYPGFRYRLPSPACFVCGPRSDREVGLRVFAGPVPGRRVVAAPVRPVPPALAPDGPIPAPVVWAMLDCPSGVAAMGPGQLPRSYRYLTRILRPPSQEDRHVVIGWLVRAEGRRRSTGSALYTEDGELLAVARTTWRILDWDWELL
ncbi:MAG: hypothetical protein HY658_07395 [Actinobacteria bacterium]|nr:hypothetical protein [Actinomycetota bacterium]